MVRMLSSNRSERRGNTYSTERLVMVEVSGGSVIVELLRYLGRDRINS